MNNNLVGIVNKPQFDESVFKVGKTIHIRSFADNGFKLMDADCIITEISPLYLKGIYYNEQQKDVMRTKISITDFVDGIYKISLLEEVINDGK